MGLLKRAMWKEDDGGGNEAVLRTFVAAKTGDEQEIRDGAWPAGQSLAGWTQNGLTTADVDGDYEAGYSLVAKGLRPCLVEIIVAPLTWDNV